MTPINARHVLAAIHLVQRQGRREAMRRLEQSDPDLAEHVMKTSSTIHRDLLELGGPARLTQRVHHDIEVLVLVGIEAVKQAAIPPPDADTKTASNESK